MIGHEATRSTAENYRRFAQREARGKSALYEELASSVADDNRVLALLASLPAATRQPNLIFAAVRFLGPTPSGYAEFSRFLVEDWAAVREVVLARSTQTNEPGRCASLLPMLSELPQPLALLEVGASAGLCLLADRYRYDYGRGELLGPPDSPVLLRCELRDGGRPPRRLPQVVWRAGLDLDPVDVTDADGMRWLEALVWPEQDERLQRLRSAAGLASADPPPVVRGDLRTDLPRLAARAPAGATLVVFHSAVLAYLPAAERDRFPGQVSDLDAVWIANEAPGVLPTVNDRPAAPDDVEPGFLVSRNGEPIAWTDPHGSWLRRI